MFAAAAVLPGAYAKVVQPPKVAGMHRFLNGAPDDALAQSLVWIGGADRAIEDLTRRIAREPHKADNYLRRALARYFTGDFTGALKDSARAIFRDERNPQAWSLRSHILLSMQDLSGSIEAAVQGAKLMVRQSRAHA